MNKNKGLTLIELIVVVAIMSVMLATVGLSVKAISDRKVSKAAQTTKSLIKVGQTYAKSNDGVCFIVVEGTSKGCAVSVKRVLKESDINDKTKWLDGYGPKILNTKVETKIYFEGYNANAETWAAEIKEGDIAVFRINKKIGGFTRHSWFRGHGKTIESYPKKICFSNGDKTVSIDIAYNTGAMYVTKEKEVSEADSE